MSEFWLGVITLPVRQPHVNWSADRILVSWGITFPWDYAAIPSAIHHQGAGQV